MSEIKVSELTVYTDKGMIALIPSAESAENLLVAGGDELDQLHLTLSYINDLTAIDSDSVLQNVRQVIFGLQNVEANVFGHALFNPGPDSATVYLVGGSGIIEKLYQEFDQFSSEDRYKPFTAHITAGYGLSFDKLDYIGPVTFDRIRVALGEDITDIYLRGDMDKEANAVLIDGWENSYVSESYIYSKNYGEFDAIVSHDTYDGVDEFHWTIFRSAWDAPEIVSDGTTYSLQEALNSAEFALVGVHSPVAIPDPIYSENKTASLDTKHAWSFSDDLQSFIIEGERVDFDCKCGRKLALQDSVTRCSNCDENWYAWTVNSADHPPRHYARTVIKRDGVILASIEDETDADLEFIDGYKWAETHTDLPEKFSDEFRVGFIRALEDQRDELINV